VIPRSSPSTTARAKTMVTAPSEPFVMKILAPSRTQPSGRRTARVVIWDGFDPAPGSVSPKAPSSPTARPGSQRVRCSSVPQRKIERATRPRLTETSDRREESAAPSSSITTR
jgi:hypothetical protein